MFKHFLSDFFPLKCAQKSLINDFFSFSLN
jgi:hypothetical protein